jgi:hypothetical protein
MIVEALSLASWPSDAVEEPTSMSAVDRPSD